MNHTTLIFRGRVAGGAVDELSDETVAAIAAQDTYTAPAGKRNALTAGPIHTPEARS
jgi:hypothetical protein